MVKVECANCGTVYKLSNEITQEKSFIKILKEIFSFFETLYFWIQIGQRLMNYLAANITKELLYSFLKAFLSFKNLAFVI